MTSRANYFELSAPAIDILMNQEAYLRAQFETNDQLSIKLWELMKLRISQINQCAFCIDMHSKAAIEMGEAAERIIGLNAWKDLPNYTPTERCVLDWAEHLTLGHTTDDSYYNQLVETIGEKTVVDLTIAVNAINSWNRIAKTFKPEIGSYKP